jgi:hypothetical protein
MTDDDAFDARLKAIFAAAQPAPDASFVERVLTRLDGSGRRRVLIIGSAGAGGSTIASTQLEALFEHVMPGSDAVSWLGDGAPILSYASPEMLAGLAFAAAVAAFAIFMPSRS